MKQKLITIFGLTLLIALMVYANGGLKLFSQKTAYAVGDLTVDWGVPEGDPIFTFLNFAPGDSENHDVQVTNAATSVRPVGVRGIKTSEVGTLGDKLFITISESGTNLYGGTTGQKTLNQFFTDSADPDGIFLANLAPSDITTYNFKVEFDESAGNDFQNTKVVFDIQIGISVNVPTECEGINFAGKPPIFGTSNSDTIVGTRGNDLIIGFEGNDRIFGGLGHDCIIGGSGDDQLRGEVGNDFVFGNEGDDLVLGGVGNDQLFGNEDNDRVRGENGIDLIFGGDGNDDMLGGNGNDILSGGNGDDTMNGENGTDLLDGEDNNDTMLGGNGPDNLIGGNGVDSANGQSGTDSCSAETEVSCEI